MLWGCSTHWQALEWFLPSVAWSLTLYSGRESKHLEFPHFLQIQCVLYATVWLHRVVKLSSPNLNYFLITGAGMLYVSIYFYTYMISGQSQTIFCNVRPVRCCCWVNGVSCAFSPDSSVLVLSGLHSLLCCHSCQNLEGVSHLQQPHRKEKSIVYIHVHAYKHTCAYTCIFMYIILVHDKWINHPHSTTMALGATLTSRSV